MIGYLLISSLFNSVNQNYCFDANSCKFAIMNSLVESNLSEIKDVMRTYGVIRAYLFGSAAIGNMSDDSDVDFMVSFNPNLSYTEYGNNYFQLIYALQKLLKKDVDIIAEETITNPYLLQSINSQKIAVL
jgi:predicted nucleotidyltransferase